MEIFTGIHSERDLSKLYKWASLHKSHILTVIDNYGIDPNNLKNLSRENIKVVYNKDKIYSYLGFIHTAVINFTDFKDILYFCDLKYHIKSPIIRCNSLNVLKSNSINIDHMVKSGVCSIDNMIFFKEEIQNRGNILLDGHIICSPINIWKYFLSFYSSLVNLDVIEKNADNLNIAINLFKIYFDELCEVAPLDYSIIAN